MKAIDRRCLGWARNQIQHCFGCIDDLPHELQNTVVNIYYRAAALRFHSQGALIAQYSEPNDPWSQSSDAMTGIIKLLKDAAHIHAAQELLPDLVEAYRQDVMTKADPADVELVTFLILAQIKYRIPMVTYKSELRVRFECWLRKPFIREFRDLHILMKTMPRHLEAGYA